MQLPTNNEIIFFLVKWIGSEKIKSIACLDIDRPSEAVKSSNNVNLELFSNIHFHYK